VDNRAPITQVLTLKDRVRMALAEAGYPNATIDGSDNEPVVDLSDAGAPPSEMCWKAFRVAGCEFTPHCFDCWHEAYDDSECPHPWPEVASAG